MRSIIGNSTVVPHVIIRVRNIEAIVAILDGILRHLRLFAACAVVEEELLSKVG